MSKIAICGDWHFGASKNSDIVLESQKRFFNNQFYSYLKDNNINEVLVLGDCFENRVSVQTKIQNEVYKLFDNEFHFTVLVGNHDCYTNTTTDINSLKFLKKFQNVRVIESMQEVNIFDTSMLLVPWIFDNEKFIEDIKGYNSKVVAGHFDINSFSMGGKNSESSLYPETFKKFKKVFSGHFHQQQTMKLENTEIIYCGSIIQNNWGDVGQKRGFYILDIDTLEYSFIENIQSAKHIKLSYGDPIIPSEISKNYVKVFIQEKDTENEEKLEEYIKQVNECNPASLSNVIIKSEDLDSTVEISEKGQSLCELINEFTDLQESIENKEEIKDLLKTIYEESLRE
jgi:DNA repair exonuclease SbcCD nuclease subunit